MVEAGALTKLQCYQSLVQSAGTAIDFVFNECRQKSCIITTNIWCHLIVWDVQTCINELNQNRFNHLLILHFAFDYCATPGLLLSQQPELIILHFLLLLLLKPYKVFFLAFFSLCLHSIPTPNSFSSQKSMAKLLLQAALNAVYNMTPRLKQGIANSGLQNIDLFLYVVVQACFIKLFTIWASDCHSVCICIFQLHM